MQQFSVDTIINRLLDCDDLNFVDGDRFLDGIYVGEFRISKYRWTSDREFFLEVSRSGQNIGSTFDQKIVRRFDQKVSSLKELEKKVLSAKEILAEIDQLKSRSTM